MKKIALAFFVINSLFSATFAQKTTDLLQQGITLAIKKQYDDALVTLTDFIQQNPDNADGYFNRGSSIG